MIDLKFSYNWNKKLDCHAFTTIRLYNSQKHYKGQLLNIFLNDTPIGTGAIQDVVVFTLSKINSFISYIDTGYPVEETINIIKKMYPNKDWATTTLALLLITKDKTKPTKQKELFQNTTPE